MQPGFLRLEFGDGLSSHFERPHLFQMNTEIESWSELLVYFGGGYTVRFHCILRDRWKMLRVRFGPSKHLKKYVMKLLLLHWNFCIAIKKCGIYLFLCLEVAAALEVIFSHKIVSNRLKVAHKLVWITPGQNVYAGPSPGFSSRGGQKPEGGAKFLKYSIGCMSQPGGQT